MSADAERRSRLLSLKLRALVRDHLGLSSDPVGTPEVFAPGAAFVADDATWILVEGDASRSLGPVLAWTARRHRPVRLLVERDSGVVARRAAMFDVDLDVWHVDERVLLPAVAEPHLPVVPARDDHLAFAPVIEAAGADVVVEHGVVVGEVRGLEMCRVVDDEMTGEPRLEVGMGAHDREAFATVHGHVPTSESLRSVIDSVSIHRRDGADPHPFNRFGAERMMRRAAIDSPGSVGFASLVPAEPPVARTNLKDAVPCVATGTRADGTRGCAVFVHGVDLDVVPFAVDAADRLGFAAVTVAMRRRDLVPSVEAMSGLARIDVSFACVGD